MTHFYKFLAGDLRHYDFTYKEGLNVDHVPFNPNGDCEPGGLYYTTFEHLPRWYSFNWPLIADVTIPADARVYAEPCGMKWKADKLVLSNIRPLHDFLKTLDEATVCGMLVQNGEMIKHVENQTEAMCMAAVQQDGYALCCVENQTETICRAAVARHPGARRYVKIPITF
jgi:hypothetical protein